MKRLKTSSPSACSLGPPSCFPSAGQRLRGGRGREIHCVSFHLTPLLVCPNVPLFIYYPHPVPLLSLLALFFHATDPKERAALYRPVLALPGSEKKKKKREKGNLKIGCCPRAEERDDLRAPPPPPPRPLLVFHSNPVFVFFSIFHFV